MVKVEIVDEKEANSPYASPSPSRTNSSESLSSVESDLSAEESLFDRLSALVDIVPPTTRHSIVSKFSSTASFLKSSGKLVGNIVWVVTTSALLVGLPLAVSLEDEAKMVQQEKEMQEQQAGAQQMMAPSMYPAPSGSQPKPLVPPGF
ncbi:mitochondrial import receptor subunit Tom22 [Stygiomarasmius scandens]|uniref:Mitochondrial import receptor subunit Tom22 n=1 Tax=Marasmiellus scandens TaxID=2682957 RepID=A0ABR1JYH4_9AGAR